MGSNAQAQYIVHVSGNNVSAHTGDSSLAVGASLRSPMAVTRDVKGRIYIGHGGPLGGFFNDACVRRIDGDSAEITTIAGWPNLPDSAHYTLGHGVPATKGRLQGVAGMCIDQFGDLLIADGKSMVKKVIMLADTVEVEYTMWTVAGAWGTTNSSGDGGPAINARLDEPYDVAVDNANNIYICEKGKHVIRKILASNDTIYTFAGRYSQGYSGDGGPASQAKLNDPRGIHIKGNTLYIADYGNNRIRAVNLSNNIITTVAGSGEMGFGGDGGPAASAKLTQPVRVTTDLAGNLYVADVGNQRIRKVDMSTGNISTYAGTGAIFSGPDVIGDNGPATAACIVPYGMVFDNCGNMFVGTSMFNVRAVVPIKPKKGVLCGVKVVAIDETVTDATEGMLHIFPDPNNGRFTLQLSTSTTKEAEVIITDITGRKVQQLLTFTNRDITIELNEPAGMYFVQVVTVDGKWSSKMIMH